MSAARPLDLLVVGDLFTDLIMSGFPSWPPHPGEEVFANQFCREAGGGAAITACGLAKLGAKVGVIGAVGAHDGEWLLDRLHSNHVNTSAVKKSVDAATAITVSVSTTIDRTFLTYVGANRELRAIVQEYASKNEFAKARHVHLAFAPQPADAEPLFQELIGQGCSLSVDIGWHPEWLSDVRCQQALRIADIFLPNEREASHMTGETDPRQILNAFKIMGLKKVALKLGRQGAALLYDEKIMFSAPVQVESIDTTGAGDCFDAGFLFAWLRGDDPQNCLRTATVCGALSTRQLGGISGFPTLAELDAYR
jgi:sugar/nucleoside kinase (ribokinase family)